MAFLLVTVPPKSLANADVLFQRLAAAVVGGVNETGETTFNVTVGDDRAGGFQAALKALECKVSGSGEEA